ncbi:MYND-type zinc finger-containing chromatin reader ZMYND8-like isoform X2 [Argopecten irradians]|uniref:MYND-type zinc finger-containing chromatin reader ZMYND8-like isoform X2 n=1 Tax=Argopecten irradians TaxID=31199 RepID=UPI0037223771
MSQGRQDNRDSISLRKRPGLQRCVTKKEAEKPKDAEKPKEKEKEVEKVEQIHESPPTAGGRGIRTRLSTGSIHMNGTYTVAVAKEIENNQNLGKDPDLDQAVSGYDSWTAEEKLKMVDFAEKFGNRAAGRRFNVGEGNIRNWRKQESELMAMPPGKRSNRGKQAAHPKMEEELFVWIRDRKAEGIDVGSTDIRNYAVKLCKTKFPDPNFKASLNWCYLFLQRHHLRLQKPITPPSSASSTPTATPSGSGRKRTQTVEGIHAQGPGGHTVPPKRRKIGRNDGSGEDNRNDYFCWLCHKEGTVICCELCPRVYHTKCLNLGLKLPKDWVCPECEKIMRAECIDTRSKAMSMISIDTLCTLLKYALERMTHQGSDPFTKPVDLSAVPYYTDYIYNAMDLGQLERNIKKKLYGCTEAFLADAKWILHNCIIFNGTHHKLTSSAKMIIKICKHEMNEIELCPDCYWNSCVRKNDEWFSETCRTPHTLVWAKLKGYPFWPAKALREEDDQVDVRFFGAHDRSWVPTSQVYMLSKDIPTPAKNKRGGFENAMDELEIHIKKIREKFGSFEYASFRMPYDKNHVYFHNKMKQPFKKARQGMRGQKFAPKQKLYTVKHVYTDSPTKVEKQSVMLKTADAVRNKYSTMVSTRRAIDTGSQNNTESLKNPGVTCNKTELSTGQTNCLSVQPVTTTISPSKVFSSKVIPTKLIKVVRLSPVKAKTILGEQKGDTTKAALQEMDSQDKVSIVDKVQDKIKQMNADNVDDEMNTSMSNKDSDSENGSDVSEQKDNKMQIECAQSTMNPKIEKDTLEEKPEVLDTVDKMDTDDSEVAMETRHNKESSMSPSKEIYLANLQKTIQSCKEKLGLSDDSVLSDEVVDDEEDEEDEDADDLKGDEDKGDLCDESKNENDSTETDVSKEDNSTETKTISDDKTSESLDSSKKKVLEKNTLSESQESANSILSDHEKERTEGETEEKSSVIKSDLKDENKSVDGTETDNSKDSSDNPVDDAETEISKDSSDYQKGSAEVDVDESKDCSEENNKDRKKEASSSEENVQSDKKNLSKIVEQENSLSESEAESKDKKVRAVTVHPPSMEVDEESNLVMEVESDSDSDNLVMDLSDDDETSKPRTITPTKPPVRISPPVVKPGNKTNDKFKQLDLTGVNKVVIIKKTSSSGEKTSSSGEKTSKSPSSSTAKPSAVKSPHSRKSPSRINKQLPSAEFFQNAIEKTMKSPNTSSEKMVDVEQDIDVDTGSESVVPAHSEIISKFTKKLMGSIQGTFEMMCSEFISQELQPKNVTKDLQAEIQKIRWEQHQQILELKHNFQLTMAEMKSCWEAEKQRIVSEINTLNNKDKEKAINETKKKQWCANCGKEAIFYCCWNTSYCDYPCQQAHWPKHMPTCMQTQQAQASANEKESGDKDSQSATTPTSEIKTSSQDSIKIMETTKSLAGSGMVTSMAKQSAPVLGSGESPINVEMEPPRPQLWDQTGAQSVHQNSTSYMCPPQQTAPPPGTVQVPQGGLQFTSIAPNTGAPSQINQQQMVQKKKPNYDWSEQSMSEAYNAVMTGGMSVNKAAKVFQVPRVRLADRIASVGKAAQFPPGNGVQQPQQGSNNNLQMIHGSSPQMLSGSSPQTLSETSPQMLPGSSHIVTSQPILQYVQSPQSIISLPPSSLPVQQFTPQMGMQTVQVQGQPTPTGLVQNQQAIVQNRQLVQPNSSVLFPMNVAGGVMPGNIVFSQSGPRPPYQIQRPY